MTPNEKTNELTTYLKSDRIIENFAGILGSPSSANSYVASVIIAVRSSDYLMKCDFDPATKQAYLVPFGRMCTMVVGWKGYYDLAMRTGKYLIIHPSKVYEGEKWIEDRLTGQLELTGSKISNKIIGWMAYFEMTNRMRKFLYMSTEEIHAHAQEYSKSYNNPRSAWKTHTEAMEMKTPLRLLLYKWGTFDVADQAALVSYDSDYNTIPETTADPGEVIDATASEVRLPPEEEIASLGFSGGTSEPVKKEETPMIDGKIDGKVTKDDYYKRAYNGSLGFQVDPELAQQIVNELGLDKDSDYAFALKKLIEHRPPEKAPTS
jgi:recombination protein RecT